MLHAMANLVANSTPDFYLENIKQMVQHGIQPYFALADVHGLELVERLIRKRYYMGPMNGFFWPQRDFGVRRLTRTLFASRRRSGVEH